jgi:hypothetical protein
MAELTDKIHDNDEDYDEEADDDFNPEAVAQDENLSDEDEPELIQPARTTKQNRKRVSANDIDVELDSGDEATIKERQKRLRKEDVSDDEGGEGGFVKTRSQRRHE